MYLLDNVEIVKRQKLPSDSKKDRSPAKKEVLQVTKLGAEEDKKKKCCNSWFILIVTYPFYFYSINIHLDYEYMKSLSGFNDHSPTCLSISYNFSRMPLKKFWKFSFSVFNCYNCPLILAFSLLWWARCLLLNKEMLTVLRGFDQAQSRGFFWYLHSLHRRLSQKLLWLASKSLSRVCRFLYWWWGYKALSRWVNIYFDVR